MNKADGVAIVGMGAVFPGAGDAAAFWRNIRAGVDAITQVPPDRWDPADYYDPAGTGSDRFYCRRGGFVDDLADFDPARFGIMPAAVAGTEPDQLLALRAAAEAIADAGGDERLPDRARIGVFVGRGGYLTPGIARLEQRVRTAHQLTSVLRELVPGLSERRLLEVRTAFQDRLGPGQAESSIGLVPNFAASRIANRFDFHGPAYTVDAACASSLIAVEHAVRELRDGRCDAVLAGAVHHCHDVTLWSVFSQLRALSPTERMRPFDAAADGTLIAEGTGMVLLKRLDDARRAGDRIYAVIRGVGVASDGRAASLMSPLADGQVLALERAWHEAGLDPSAPDSLGLLEAHGTATPTGDRVELTTLARVFGPSGGRPIGLGTVKSMIGHTMPASGIAGLIKAAFAVHDGVMPPTLHIDEPHPGLAATRFAPVTRERPWDEGLPRRAAVNAFGFGGINAHLILESDRSATTPSFYPDKSCRRRAHRALHDHLDPAVKGSVDAAHAPEPMLMLSAATAAEIAGLLEADDEILLASAGTEPPADAGPCRLAIIDPDPRKLELARKIVERGTPWRGRSDLWFTPRPLLDRPGRVALVFPGFEPDSPARIDDLGRHFDLPAPRLHGTGDLVEHAVDVVAVGRFLAAALAEIGVTADVMAGHSLGEWTAMIVGGLYDRSAVDEFIASLRPGMVEVPDVVYAALGCGAERASSILRAAGLDDVVLSHDNCPHQTVVCGAPERIDRAVAALAADGIMALVLPYRSGFHSPMLAPYLGAAHTALERLPIRRPTTAVWSATSVAPFPEDPAAVRELVIRHLVEPVRFRSLLARLHESGIRAFVQVGPGSLTAFVEDTLRGKDHLVIPANLPNRDGLSQLRRVAAALWVEGMAPRFDRLRARDDRPAGRPPMVEEAPSKTTVRLDLGTPMIRLDGAVDTLQPQPVALPGASRMYAELEALLAETTDVAGAVVAALEHGDREERDGREDCRGKKWSLGAPESPRQSSRPTIPSREVLDGRAAGTTCRGETGAPAPVEASVTRTFSLETMPEVADHCIMPQPDGWPDDSDRFPVVPLTTMLEVMAQAAQELLPGMVVTGFEQVRAARWLIVAPPTTARIHAVSSDHLRVKVTIEGYASGVVVLAADGYPPAPDRRDTPLTGERPPVVDARRLYDDNWMFHGPAFAGVTEMVSVADNGLTGVLTALPAKGALLDSAGQLIGHWMQISVPVDQTVFPVGIEAIHFYGPRPRDGDRLGCTAWIHEPTDTGMRADAELRDAAGRVWARIDRWSTHRFATDDQTLGVKFRPDRAGVGEAHADGWCLVRERWPNTASRELMMRRYLNAAERAGYDRLNPRAQRQWLLGRIAAKDAVRYRLWEQGAPPIYPAEITIRNDEHGRPHAEGAGPASPGWIPSEVGYGLDISIAHTEGMGVAVVGAGPVGIDVEPVAVRGPGTEQIALNDSERALLDGHPDAERPTWFARFWTAKEAVAKALGHGLRGRPQRFEVTSVDAGGELAVTVDGAIWRVRTHLVGDEPYVVAVTQPYEEDTHDA